MSGRRPSLARLKTFLASVCVVGFLTWGVTGTYAVLNVGQTHTGSTASSGTLTFTTSVKRGSTTTSCDSNGSGSSNNVQTNCTALFQQADGNFNPGSPETVTVTITNSGSVPIGDLSVYVPQTGGPATSTCVGDASNSPGYTPGSTALALRTALVSGAAVSSLPVAPIDAKIISGATVKLVSGGNNQTFTTNAVALPGDTTISVVSQNANFSYPTTSTVTAQAHWVYNPCAYDPPNGFELQMQELDGSSNDVECWFGAGIVQQDCGSSFDSLAYFSQNYYATTSALDLGSGPAAGASRIFRIELEVPAFSPSAFLEGQEVDFSLNWHISQ